MVTFPLGNEWTFRNVEQQFDFLDRICLFFLFSFKLWDSNDNFRIRQTKRLTFLLRFWSSAGVSRLCWLASSQQRNPSNENFCLKTKSRESRKLFHNESFWLPADRLTIHYLFALRSVVCGLRCSVPPSLHVIRVQEVIFDLFKYMLNFFL